MYTQCPNCRAIFEVDEDTLQASLGIVCCGNCGQRFDALRTLSDRIPAGPDPVLPERNPEALSPILTQRVAPRAEPPVPAADATIAAERGSTGGAPTDARRAARSGARARALIAEAAGISRDAILEDPAWQVTELPVLTAIILNEPISPADLGDAATMLELDGGHPEPAAVAAPPANVPTPAEAWPDSTPPTTTPDAPRPGPPTDAATPELPLPPAVAGDVPTEQARRAASGAIPTAAFLQVEDAAGSDHAEPPDAPIDAPSPGAPPAAADVPDPPESDVAVGAGRVPAAPSMAPRGGDAVASPLERWLGGGLPDGGEIASPADAPAAMAPEPGTAITGYAELPPEASLARPAGAAEPAAPEPADLEPTIPEPVYIAPRRPRLYTRNAWWLLGCAALALGLALQLAWAQRAEFVRNPATRAWALRTCARVDCHLPPIRDVDRLVLVSRDIRPDPSQPGVLSITATLRNDAPFRQPWPLVVVRMTNIDNRVVAMRRFRPAEYLPRAARRAAGIPPGVTMAVAFEVRDPGRQATGFRFDFE